MKKQFIMFFAAAMAAVAALAEPNVTDVVAKQRYPWNGLVDITCKVTGINGTTNGLLFKAWVMATSNEVVCSVSHLWIVQNGTKSTDLAVHTNGNYRLLWDAKADLGQVKDDDAVIWITFNAHGKVQLWEGGPYWAETNLGADVPREFGYYFWWGDTIGYKRENDKWVASDGSSSNFSFDKGNTPTYNKNIATLQSEGWITADSVLTPEHDAAHAHWGGNWRIPTKQELADLVSKCDWTWTTMGGIDGYVVKGKGSYASASIFLPCAGSGDGTSLYNAGSDGRYWSSVPDSDDRSHAWGLYFNSGPRSTSYDGLRDSGLSVRPVQGFTE